MAEDFLNGKCVKSNADVIQQILRSIPSKAFFQQSGNHHKASLSIPKDPAKVRAIRTETNAKVPQAVRAAASKSATDNKVITMVGVDCRGSLIIGGGRDCFSLGEINYPDGTKAAYYMNMLTIGLQVGHLNADVVWTTIEADAATLDAMVGAVGDEGTDVTYDFFLGGVALHLVIGGTFQLVFDKNWKVIGTRGGPGIGLDIGLFVGALGFR